MRFKALILPVIIILLLCLPAIGQLEFIGEYAASGDVDGVFVLDDYAYITVDGMNLRIIDVSNPESPIPCGIYEASGNYALNVFVSGKFAYMSAWSDHLRIIDVSDPFNPVYAAMYNAPGLDHDVVVIGNNAYIVTCPYLTVVDIGDAYQPNFISELNADFSDGRNIVFSENYAYVSDFFDGGLETIDVSNPLFPQSISYYQTEDMAYAVTVNGGYAFIAVASAGLEIVDLFNPENPQHMSTYYLEGVANDIYCFGNYAFVTTQDNGLHVLDVTNLYHPLTVDDYAAGSYINDIFIDDGLIYITRDSRLTILQFTTTGIKQGDDTPRRISCTGNYPNPFNSSTTIKYELPRTADVIIEIFDLLGRRVTALVNEQLQAGYHQAIWNADDFPLGVYFYKLQAGDYSESKKMIMLK